MNSRNRNLRIQTSDKGMTVTYKGNVIKEGPIHEIRDWMDWKDSCHYYQARLRLKRLQNRKKQRCRKFIKKAVLNGLPIF